MKSEFNTDQWPVVICTIAGRVNNEEAFQSYLTNWSKLYLKASDKKTKFSLVFDIRKLDGVDMKYLLGQAMFLKKTKSLTELWLNRSSILVNKPSIRRILDFVFTIYRPIRPFKVFTDPCKAFQWVQSSEEGDEVVSNDKLSQDEIKHLFSEKKF